MNRQDIKPDKSYVCSMVCECKLMFGISETWSGYSGRSWCRCMRPLKGCVVLAAYELDECCNIRCNQFEVLKGRLVEYVNEKEKDKNVS